MSATENLLAEFPPVPTADWEAAIAADLKGDSYDEKLIWHMPEGPAIRPYYRADDFAGLGFVCGARAEAGWRIREEVAATAPADANRAAVAALAAGAEEIAFRGVSIANQSDLALLLLHLGEVPVHFACAGESTIRLLLEFLNSGPRFAPISADIDPFDNLAFAAQAIAAIPGNFVPFTIDAVHAAPAQANAIEQTGWALAAAVDFLGAMEERGMDADRAAAIEFSFPIGANYFFEIARLRAFRMLWARVVESFGGSRRNAQARIVARTAYPPAGPDNSHWNMLRATTETMAAILGGADSISIAPFSQSQDEAAGRLARNTQLLLKQEAFFARVTDPGGGSYYLENLTGTIAAEAWRVMQSIEARGGYRLAERNEKRTSTKERMS